MGDESNQRNYFRLRYPIGVHPVLAIDGRSLDVTELSEGGLRVLAAGTLQVLGRRVAGVLHLCSGGSLRVEARVTRLDGEECVLTRLQGVDFAAVLREQQHLRATCPDHEQGA